MKKLLLLLAMSTQASTSVDVSWWAGTTWTNAFKMGAYTTSVDQCFFAFRTYGSGNVRGAVQEDLNGPWMYVGTGVHTNYITTNWMEMNVHSSTNWPTPPTNSPPNPPPPPPGS